MGDLVLKEAKKLEEWETFPDDTVVVATVREVNLYTSKMTDDNGDPVKRVKFKFQINSPESMPAEDGHPIPTWYTNDEGEKRYRYMYGETSANFSDNEKCKLYNWTKAILCADQLPEKFTLRVEDNGDIPVLVGKQCRIALEVNEWRDKKNPVDDGSGNLVAPIKRNNRVKAVARISPGAEPTPTQSAADPAFENLEDAPF